MSFVTMQSIPRSDRTCLTVGNFWDNSTSTLSLLLSYCHSFKDMALMYLIYMMTSSNGSTFRVTGLLCGEFTGPWCIPRTKASDAEFWCFPWYVSGWNGWANNGDAGDLRRYFAHYDVIVMTYIQCPLIRWHSICRHAISKWIVAMRIK